METKGSRNELLSRITGFMGSYVESRKKTKFSANAEVAQAFEAIKEEISSLGFLRNFRLKVTGSVGKGNWAFIPWIAILDERETSSVHRGVYPAIFFHQNMLSITLALAQGSTDIRAFSGADASAKLSLQLASREIRKNFPNPSGFKTEPRLNLNGSSNRAAAYEDGTICYKTHDLPLDVSEFTKDLERLVASYVEKIETILQIDKSAPKLANRHSISPTLFQREFLSKFLPSGPGLNHSRVKL